MGYRYIKIILFIFTLLTVVDRDALLFGDNISENSLLNKKIKKDIHRIGSSLPLWERYLEKSKNIRDGAAFIPLAMRMVILQLGVRDRKDLYNLDVQILLSLKKIAFFKGYKEGSKEFDRLINQTARRGDRIEMTIHPEKKTIDIRIYGAIINLDVFDIYLATLDLEGIEMDEGESKFTLTAVIGEKSLIIDKNFKTRKYIEEFTALDSIAFTDIHKEMKVKPIFHYQQKNYDFSASLFYQKGGLAAALYFTGINIHDDEESYYYRYLLGISGSDIIPQMEFGTAGEGNGFYYQYSANMGYNINNNTILVGFAGNFFHDNISAKLESSFFNTGEEKYDKNDMELTPRLELGGAYLFEKYLTAYLGGIYQQTDFGVRMELKSCDLMKYEFIKYLFKNKFGQWDSNSLYINASYEQLFSDKEQDDINYSDPLFEIGFIYNFRMGLPYHTKLNTFSRKNLRAFSK